MFSVLSAETSHTPCVTQLLNCFDFSKLWTAATFPLRKSVNQHTRNSRIDGLRVWIFICFFICFAVWTYATARSEHSENEATFPLHGTAWLNPTQLSLFWFFWMIQVLFFCSTTSSRLLVRWAHGCIMKSGYSEVGRPPFIPMTAAQWRMKSKWLDFPGLKIAGSEAVHWAHRASALETLLLLRLCVIREEPGTSSTS